MSSVVGRPEPKVHANGHGPDAPDAPEPPRRPFVPVGLALAGLVIVVLAAAFVLDRQYRQPVGIEPAPPIAVKALPTAVPAAAGPSVAPVARAVQPTVVPTAVPTSTTAPATAGAVTAPLPKVAGEPTTASAAAPATPKPPSPLEKEIIDGYLRYWNVRSQAYYDLDPTRLSEVMAGAELAREEEGIRKLRADGRAGGWDVDLNFRIDKATPEEAVVYDEYVNRSVYLDAVTKQELPTKEPPGVFKISFLMKKVDGVWKVVDGTRHD